MSKLESIKKQYPELNISVIDVLARLDNTKTLKYLPVLCKVLREIRNKYAPHHSDIEGVVRNLRRKNIRVAEEECNDGNYVMALYTIADYIHSDVYDIGHSFMDYMERGLIENKDVLTYNSLEEMSGAISVASLKLQSKELEKQAVKVYEDEEWLVVRPLTFEASSKYGAGTKWCTTYVREKQYFARYWKKGILAYFINKINGVKWGMFKTIDKNYEDELSWWNTADKRVDFLEINFNEKMYSVTRTLLQSTQTNKDLCDEKLQKLVISECEDNYPTPSPEIEYTAGIEVQPTDETIAPEPGFAEAALRVIGRGVVTGETYQNITNMPIVEMMTERISQEIDRYVLEQRLQEQGIEMNNMVQAPQNTDRLNDMRQYQEPQDGGGG